MTTATASKSTAKKSVAVSVQKVVAAKAAVSKKATAAKKKVAPATKVSKKPVAAAAKALVKKTVPVKPAKPAKKVVGKVAKVAQEKDEMIIHPVKEKMNRTQMLQHFADGLMGAELVETERDAKKIVKHLLEAQQALILGSVHHRGIGEITIPGLFKIFTRKMPARPARKMISPLSGLEITTKPKPASVRVKIRPMKLLKEAAAK